MAISSETKTVTTTATVITVGVGSPPIRGDRGHAVLVQNNSTLRTLYIGGPDVTADTSATGGVQIAVGGSIPLGELASSDTLYGIVATGTAAVAILKVTA